MNPDFSQIIFQQIIDLWINPEIGRRKESSRISEDFKLEKAQVIFSLDRGWNKVRLNEEVKAFVEFISEREIKKERGFLRKTLGISKTSDLRAKILIVPI